MEEVGLLESIGAIIAYFMTLGGMITVTGLPFFILLGIIGILLIFALVVYILTSIPLHKMAKNAGIPNPWLAWVPYGNIYIMLVLAKREFNIFNWIKTYDRTKVFWIYLIVVLGMPVVTSVLSGVSFIPIVGILISMISSLLSIVYFIAVYIFNWRVYYDIYMTYGMQNNAMVLSILSVLCPIVFIVYLFMMKDRQPDYNV